MLENHHIIIGSRSSALAVRQAEMVRDELIAHSTHLQIIIKTFQTSGDAYLLGNLSEIGNKGLFTKEIEQALLGGAIDIAVHSMKDVATILPDGLIIPAMLPRDDVRDTLLSPHASTIATLPQNAILGTSSLRRAVQVKHLRPDINVVNYRGNVQRRLAKLEEGIVDATLLAQAGLDRLSITHPNAHPIEITEILPAVSQGAIGMQCRSTDFAMIELLEQINHDITHSCVSVERHLLRLLDGSCRTPIAAYATLDKGIINLRGMIAAHDASWLQTHQLSGLRHMGRQLAEDMADFLRG